MNTIAIKLYFPYAKMKAKIPIDIATYTCILVVDSFYSQEAKRRRLGSQPINQIR